MSLVHLLLLISLLGDPDIIIRGGHVVDGSGNPWFTADVAIRDGVITEIAPRIAARGIREIDARGLVVAPGFIDLHTHARGGIFDDPSAEYYIREGVTTIFEGPDGSSPLPIGEFLDRVEHADPAVNFGTFVGHGSIRGEVIGQDDRAPSAKELEQMRALVRQSMEEGAFGLSSGLFYTPGSFATTEEVIELAEVAGESDGIYISHMRDEMGGLLDSVRETIRIGEEGGLPAQITHHKVIGRIHEGLGAESLELIDQARARGIDITSDLYPYTASSTGLGSAMLPAWANEGGRERMLERFSDPETRARIRAHVIEKIERERGSGDPAAIQIASAAEDREIEGMNLTEIMIARGIEPTIENAADLILHLLERGYVSGIFHAISESDLEKILVHPASMIASDGELAIPGRGSPHPRCCGTFPRVISVYVRQKGILSLEEAIRKMSSFPAQRVGLLDRGLLRPGLKADIVVFDPGEIRDRATFEDPHQYATGVDFVIINGELVLDDGTMTSARPGTVLRK